VLTRRNLELDHAEEGVECRVFVFVEAFSSSDNGIYVRGAHRAEEDDASAVFSERSPHEEGCDDFAVAAVSADLVVPAVTRGPVRRHMPSHDGERIREYSERNKRRPSRRVTQRPSKDIIADLQYWNVGMKRAGDCGGRCGFAGDTP
jgi:hypothetical protein